jgi:hypothetical protein
MGGGTQLERIRPRAATFMPMIPICFSTARGRSCSMKLWTLFASAALRARMVASKGCRFRRSMMGLGWK